LVVGLQWQRVLFLDDLAYIIIFTKPRSPYKAGALMFRLVANKNTNLTDTIAKVTRPVRRKWKYG
jgi:hypothetical protein